jgi:hypothetical protein
VRAAGVGEDRVGGAVVGHAVDEAADGLDAGGEEHVALAGLDGVAAMRIACSDDEQ